MASFFPQHVAATISLAAHLFAEDLSIASITAVTAAYRSTGLQERLVPHAAVHLLPACGHSPHRDQPERLTALVREWLAASRQPRVFSS